jgi:hypothetical protein
MEWFFMGCTRTILKTEKVNILFKMCAISRGSLLMMLRRVKESREGRIISIRGSGKITISMGQVKVATLTRMVLLCSGTSVSLRMERRMVMESTDGLMVIFIRGSG